MANITSFDHHDLLRAVEVFPQIADNIEPYLADLVHQWVMLLQPEGYDDLAELINIWEIKIGHTEVFVQTLKFLKEACKSKKGLLKKIKSLT
jgi:hypothetical protein